MIFKDFLLPVLNLVSSLRVAFPGGSAARRVVCYKVIDALYMISLRIGFENTRQHMTYMLQKFFASFNRVYDENFLKESKEEEKEKAAEEDKTPEATSPTENMYFELKLDSETKEFKINKQSATPDTILQHRHTGSDGRGHARTGSGTFKPEVRGHQRQSSGTHKFTLTETAADEKGILFHFKGVTGRLLNIS